MIRRTTLGAVVLLSACAAPPRPATVEDLVGTWRFSGHVPVGARIPTLAVTRDGSVRGNTGVNRFQTAIDLPALAEGSFRIEPTATTRMAGTQEAMALELAFLEALGAADSAVIERDALVLKRGEQELMRMDRMGR